MIVYGLIFMVPIAPFAIFGPVFNASHGMVLLTYVIGLVAMLFTALSYREISRAFPVAGSVYAYASRGIANWVGFIAGWALILDYLLIPTLLYVTGAAAMAAVLPAVPGWLWVVIFLVLNTVVNLAGVELGAWVNRVFLIGELLVLTIFIVLAVIAINNGTGGAHWSTLPFDNPRSSAPAWCSPLCPSPRCPSSASTRSPPSPRRCKAGRGWSAGRRCCRCAWSRCCSSPRPTWPRCSCPARIPRSATTTSTRRSTRLPV